MTDESRPVRDEDGLDVVAVEAWLGRGPIAEVRQFPGGASNLTYLLRMAGGDELILRRPPAGTKAKGAHDMGREFGIQQALKPVFTQVPTMVAHATADESPLGTEFYVMERLHGLIPRRDFGFPVSAEQADRLCADVVATLVDLHSIDVDAVPGLAALNKGEGYVARQVGGWTKRLANARTDDTGDWSDITGWLDANQPADVGSTMIHNDYRFDNMVLDAADPTRIVGLLDWELATVGDPLMELGCTLAYWVEQGDDEFFLMVFSDDVTLPVVTTGARREDPAAFLRTGPFASPQAAGCTAVAGYEGTEEDTTHRRERAAAVLREPDEDALTAAFVSLHGHPPRDLAHLTPVYAISIPVYPIPS